jgi:hypothetical protein
MEQGSRQWVGCVCKQITFMLRELSHTLMCTREITIESKLAVHV